MSGSDVDVAVTDWIVSKEIPAAVEDMTGFRPHINTVKRWRSNGVAGVRLRCEYFGGTYRTTRTWLAEFFAASSEAKQTRRSRRDPTHAGQPRRPIGEVAKPRAMTARQQLEARGVL
ncbi:DUF1580 domain-containing protein [Rhodopirellula sp. SWK7]|uniref:DUF1580 domain-containing protein n=1 Tax=Rhodopirellula sp. SWK7 TaxID=595460 RepID=UPI0002BE100E|nr:DUF1580 domain-containing protein [Rhodopirellula sp. SWK7]EMI41685.1 hypothetical protein RRSWK_05782 [Rhodopirellula sp. SWK7]